MGFSGKSITWSALPVADRFHLIHNLAEALTQVFTTQGRALDAVNATGRQQPIPLPDGTSAVPVPPPPTPPAEQARRPSAPPAGRPL